MSPRKDWKRCQNMNMILKIEYCRASSQLVAQSNMLLFWISVCPISVVTQIIREFEMQGKSWEITWILANLWATGAYACAVSWKNWEKLSSWEGKEDSRSTRQCASYRRRTFLFTFVWSLFDLWWHLQANIWTKGKLLPFLKRSNRSSTEDYLWILCSCVLYQCKCVCSCPQSFLIVSDPVMAKRLLRDNTKAYSKVRSTTNRCHYFYAVVLSWFFKKLWVANRFFLELHLTGHPCRGIGFCNGKRADTSRGGNMACSKTYNCPRFT